jgi:putative colanic acid biosynthesis glycosyltransferase WcaI
LEKAMRILFLTDNFPPEGNAPATRTYEHAVEWVKAGHNVDVITCAPNFPEGKVYTGYTNKWWFTENIDGIRVVRVKTYITANEGFARRTLDYMSFMVTAFFAGLFLKRPDVIIGTSPQFFTVCGAWLLSFFRRRPFIFELRDLWPASIKAVGAMNDSLAIRVLEKIEMFLYRRARVIISVTNSFKSELISRGIDGNKISVIINGVDLKQYSPRKKDAELETEYDLKDKFVVGYIGTHGMAHALQNILEAAKELHSRKEIMFLLVGGGARRDALVHQAKSMQLDNVRFIQRQPKEMMPRIWSLCDVSLIQLRDDPLFKSVIPSKIFESMGMGLPILFSLPEGEATQIIRESKSGMVIPPEQPEILAEAVVSLCENPDSLNAFAEASAKAASAHSRAMQAKKMLQVLKTTVS